MIEAQLWRVFAEDGTEPLFEVHGLDALEVQGRDFMVSHHVEHLLALHVASNLVVELTWPELERVWPKVPSKRADVGEPLDD